MRGSDLTLGTVASVLRWFGAALMLALGVTGCGGGGGGNEQPSLVLRTPLIETSFVARNPPPLASLEADISGIAVGTEVFVAVSGGQDVLADAQLVRLDVKGLALTLPIRTDLAAGTYNSSVTVRLCRNASCNTTMADPVTARLVVNVRPNIELQPLVTLSRTGNEAAPITVVPLTIPAAAGEVYITHETPGLEAKLVGGALEIRTEQQRSGVWEFNLNLASPVSGEYHARTTVRYTVLAPPGGELPLSVDPPVLNVQMSGGDSVTKRVRVIPPTWLSAPVQAILSEYNQGLLSVKKVDDFTFDVTIHAPAIPRGHGDVQMTFKSGPHIGESATLVVNYGVNPALTLERTPELKFDDTSTAESLRWRSPVASFDGAQWRWTAVSDKPWLRPVRSTGLTGVDELEIALDAQRFSDNVSGEGTANLTLSIDKPGSLPVTVVVPVVNRLPAVKLVAPGAIVGERGRLFVSGNRLDSDIFRRGGIQVLGARVLTATAHRDRRAHDSHVFELEVDSAAPGTPIDVRIAHPVLTTRVLVPVLPQRPAMAGRVVLPDDLYSLPSFSARHASWYFTGKDHVWRLHAGPQGWTTSAVALAGVIDVDPLADEATLRAVGSRWVAHLDPVTLGTTALFTPAAALGDVVTIGAQRMARLKTLAHHVDGTAYVTATLGAATSVHAIDMGEAQATRTFRWAYASFLPSDPGPIGLTRSADHRRMAAHAWDSLSPFPISQINVQGSFDMDRATFFGGVPKPGRRLIGTAGIGALAGLFDDGTVLSATTATSLNALVPITHTAVGHALNADASRALVHAVRRQGQGTSEYASDALLLVVDLSAGSRLAATVPMTGPVGCLLPRDATQPCDPGAAVVFEPQGRAALVIGRQAAEVVPLPEAAVTAAGSGPVPARARDSQVMRAVVGR